MPPMAGRSDTIATAEDPFGPGDPLEVARLVRRALAAAGRRAVEVTELVLVTDRAPSPEALARFTRRSLGPHGAAVPSEVHLVASAMDHEGRVAVAREVGDPGDLVVSVVVLGPGALATALCIGGRSAAGRTR